MCIYKYLSVAIEENVLYTRFVSFSQIYFFEPRDFYPVNYALKLPSPIDLSSVIFLDKYIRLIVIINHTFRLK